MEEGGRGGWNNCLTVGVGSPFSGGKKNEDIKFEYVYKFIILFNLRENDEKEEIR